MFLGKPTREKQASGSSASSEVDLSAAASSNVSALERGISVLRCFDEMSNELSNQQLSQLTGIPKPTVTRLTATLVNLGLLKQDAVRESYMLGPGVMPLARAFLANLNFRATARPLMQEFSETNEGTSVYLGLHDDLNMVIVEACRARSSMISARIDVGSRTPISNSALGRAFMSVCDAAERERIFSRLQTDDPTRWRLLAPGLMKALELAEHDGFCLSMGEWHREINSVSVGFKDAHGEILSLNCGGATYMFPEERLRWDIAPKLHHLASTIAERIGGYPPPTLGGSR
jgi:IclR family transcriptional regulator, positive regulator for flagellar biogenesis